MRSTRFFLTAAGLAAVALGSSLPAGGASTRSAAAPTSLTITATGNVSGLGGPTSGTFELVGANGAETDLGKLKYTMPLNVLARKTPEGLSYTPLQTTLTFTGKNGTLVLRATAREFDVVKQDDTIATGTWSMVKGTGRYAGTKGGGSLVGIRQAAGSGAVTDYVYSFRFEGRVSKG